MRERAEDMFDRQEVAFWMNVKVTYNISTEKYNFPKQRYQAAQKPPLISPTILSSLNSLFKQRKKEGYKTVKYYK